ncbi:hypothetical protein HK100_002365, partial [Physocladia obscura]
MKLPLPLSLSLSLLLSLTRLFVAADVSSCLSAATSAVDFGPHSEPSFQSALADQYNQDALGSTIPLAFTYPTSESEISAIVECAAEYSTPIVARCGGHSYESFSVIENGIVVDLQNFLDITIDSSSQTVTIGAGNWLGKVYVTLEDQGFTLPGGDCPHVGIAGHTMGGGFGLFSRQLGLMVDALLEVRLIDATGTLRVVNAQTDYDLFWAIRGAGANNFGIITSFKFHIFPLPSSQIGYQVYTWNDGSQRKEIINLFTANSALFSAEITASIYTSSASSPISLTVVSWGNDFSDTKYQSMISSLPSGYSLQTAVTSGYVDLILLIWSWKGWTRDSLLDRSAILESGSFKSTSLYSQSTFSSAGLTALIDDGLISNNAYSASLEIDSWGGAIAAVPLNATSFIHRGATFIGYQASVTTYSGSTAEADALESWRSSLSSYVVNEAYQNYIDSNVPQDAYYGAANLPVLQSIKNRLDPNNVWYYPGGFKANVLPTPAPGSTTSSTSSSTTTTTSSSTKTSKSTSSTTKSSSLSTTTTTTSTTTITTTTTTTTIATSQSSGVCAAPWESSKAYTTGTQASVNNINYVATYWTQGVNPSTALQYGGWNLVGACSNSGASSATSTQKISSTSKTTTSTSSTTTTTTTTATTSKATTTTTATSKTATTTTSTTTATATSQNSGVACAAPWDSSIAYTAGTQASVNNNNYVATYWTQGVNPSTAPRYGGWDLVGACSNSGGGGGGGIVSSSSSTHGIVTTTTTTTKTTTTTTTKTTKTTATTSSGGGTTTCAAAWSAVQVYTNGMQASVDGINYVATYWTQGVNPSTAPLYGGWSSLGLCSGGVSSSFAEKVALNG